MANPKLSKDDDDDDVIRQVRDHNLQYPLRRSFPTDIRPMTSQVGSSQRCANYSRSKSAVTGVSRGRVPVPFLPPKIKITPARDNRPAGKHEMQIGSPTDGQVDSEKGDSSSEECSCDETSLCESEISERKQKTVVTRSGWQEFEVYLRSIEDDSLQFQRKPLPNKGSVTHNEILDDMKQEIKTSRRDTAMAADLPNNEADDDNDEVINSESGTSIVSSTEPSRTSANVDEKPKSTSKRPPRYTKHTKGADGKDVDEEKKTTTNGEDPFAFIWTDQERAARRALYEKYVNNPKPWYEGLSTVPSFLQDKKELVCMLEKYGYEVKAHHAKRPQTAVLSRTRKQQQTPEQPGSTRKTRAKSANPRLGLSHHADEEQSTETDSTADGRSVDSEDMNTVRKITKSRTKSGSTRNAKLQHVAGSLEF